MHCCRFENCEYQPSRSRNFAYTDISGFGDVSSPTYERRYGFIPQLHGESDDMKMFNILYRSPQFSVGRICVEFPTRLESILL
jgi:hypothetical protein